MVSAPMRRNAPYQEPVPISNEELGKLRISMLLQGESGGGKTHMLCSMPQPIVVGYTDPNLSVPSSFIRAGCNITLYPIKCWADFEWFIRKTKNREWDAATVALDSYTFIGDRLVLEKMEDGGNTKGDGNLKIQVWNHVKNDQWTAMMDLVSATTPAPGKPSYHVVVTIHEREEYERTVLPSGGAEPQFTNKVIAVQPAVPGSLRDGFGRMFDCVFIVQERNRTEKQSNGTIKVVGSEHILWSVPPDQLRHTKDGVGGEKGGPGGCRTLPPTVQNTWEALCGAWGMDPFTMKVTG